MLPILLNMAAVNPAQLISPSDLKGVRTVNLYVHERWIFGECRGQAERIYVHIDKDDWVVLAPNMHDACWMLSAADAKAARVTRSETDTHYRVRDVGTEYKVNGQKIYAVTQKRLGNRIEICIEFANATDLTAHYNLVTHESSLYFIKG